MSRPLALLTIVALTASTAWAANVYDYDSGTVGGVNWDGTGHLWWSTGGGYNYSGETTTQASANVDYTWVRTKGHEVCWGNEVDVDWNKTFQHKHRVQDRG